MRIESLRGKTVAVWGAGAEAQAAWTALRKYLPRNALTLICRDQDRETALAFAKESECMFCDEPSADLLANFSVVVKSPGISPYQDAMIAAQQRGVQFTSGSAIWFAESAQRKTICVTGTKGKSTCSALIAHLLRSANIHTALSGNIGKPLLELLDVEIEPAVWVIEMSSFQTYDFSGAPSIAVVLNVLEEHLDWHQSKDNYQRDKLRLLENAKHAVLNAQDKVCRELVELNCETLWFSRPSDWHIAGVGLAKGERQFALPANHPLVGEHNLINLCAALTAIDALGCDAAAMIPHIATFRCLPHRLQILGDVDGLTYVNDSISTTPHSAIAALACFSDRPVAIILGGFDRQLDWAPVADYLKAHPLVFPVLQGANALRIAVALNQAGVRYRYAKKFAAAVSLAQSGLETGGVVLLSPGSASFDQFKNYDERGREFAELVGFDPKQIAEIEGLGV